MDLEQVVKQTGTVVNELISKCSEYKNRLVQTEKQVVVLQEQLRKSEALIVELREDYKRVTEELDRVGEKDNSDHKIRINRLIEEVNSCIARLEE